MLAIVCPGQGSQTPGFLTPWLELPGFADRMHWLSAAAGIDLVKHGTTSDEATIRDTAVAQPLIVAAGLVSLLELFPHPSDAYAKVGVTGGHSVGEITVAAATGVLSAEQAMVFVRERGNAMARAAAATPTGMSAVVGGDPQEVTARILECGLTPANQNGAGQIVAAGTMLQLAELAENPPAKARVIPLKVAGAFHTDHMAPAVSTLAGYARAISTHDPRTLVTTNSDGTIVHDGREILKRLVAQVSKPVRWDLCMDTFAQLGVTGLIEIPPAGTLTNLAKRSLKGVETLALRSPADIAKAHAMIAEHGRVSTVQDAPAWRLLVAPAKGTVRVLASAATGEQLVSSDPVARVETLRDSHDVTARYGGTIVEWLVEDGDPVSPGQPLVRFHPAANILDGAH